MPVPLAERVLPELCRFGRGVRRGHGRHASHESVEVGDRNFGLANSADEPAALRGSPCKNENRQDEPRQPCLEDFADGLALRDGPACPRFPEAHEKDGGEQGRHAGAAQFSHWLVEIEAGDISDA